MKNLLSKKLEFHPFLVTILLGFFLLLPSFSVYAETGSAIQSAPEATAGAAENNAANKAITAQQLAAKAAAPGATAADVAAAQTAQLEADRAKTAENAAKQAVANPSIDASAIYECKGGLTLINPFTWGHCAMKAVAAIILEFANVLLGFAGVLFNYAVVKTVFEFSTVIGNSPGLLVAWGILRDIGNIILLFGFIFMGVGVILDLHSFPAKKALPQLIIFAILMNFSLFAAEAVIDTSNVFSSVLYSQANSDPCNINPFSSAGPFAGKTATSNESDNCLINNGIAGHILEATGLASVWGGEVFAINVTTYLFLALFATIAAVVLFAGAIMLIIRAVVLTFLMVTAPIGFAGMAVPILHGAAKKWWDTLFAQSFFAPVFLLCIFVSLKITDGLASGKVNFATAIQGGNAGFLSVLLLFFIVIGFLVVSLVIAKKMGAMGAGFATNVGTKLAFGGVALGSNQVFNRAGRGLTNLQQRVAPKNGVAKFATKNLFQPLAKTNVDLRRLPGVAPTLAFAGAGDGAKANDHLTVDGVKHLAHEYYTGEAEKEREYNNQVSQRKLLEELKKGIKLSPESVKFLSALSIEELEAMHEVTEGNEQIAEALSPEKFEGLMKSKNLSESEKANIKDARFAPLASAVNSPAGAARTDDIKKIVRNLSKTDLENLPSDLLGGADVLNELTDKQRDDLAGSQKRTNAERQAVRDTSPSVRFEKLYSTGATSAAFAEFVKLTPTQVSKLDRAILQASDVAKKLTPSMLMELQESKKLTVGEITAIANHISSDPTSPGYDYVQGKISPKSTYWS